MKKSLLIILLCSVFLLYGCTVEFLLDPDKIVAVNTEYSDSPYTTLNDNIPGFSEDDYTTESYEFYSELDRLGRCGYAEACIGKDLMPKDKRESINQVEPSGWVNNSYDFIDGGYLYNRCHLIGFQLTGENANERNLITGTRYMNVEGMLPFENMVADYIKETGNHVLYRVTPVFEEDNLVAKGIQIEAWSVEDDGYGICFNVFCFNVQPGVSIDYKTGENYADEGYQTNMDTGEFDYILNLNSHKFHDAACGQAQSISKNNRQEYIGDRQNLIDQGYVPAGCCNP